MKKIILSLGIVFSLAFFSFAEEGNLLLDGFEGAISGGPDGTLDFGAGGGSNVEVVAIKSEKQEGTQAIEVTYDAVPGGYLWVARGFELDAKNAGWLVKPEKIDWKQYKAIGFWMYGSDSKGKVAFDVKDNGGEMWRYLTVDNFKGWKQIVCPFNEFSARSDWQPDAADKNGTMDFPLKSYQLEPLPPAKGTLIFDRVELLK